MLREQSVAKERWIAGEGSGGTRLSCKEGEVEHE